jgi:hypothetical protein
MTTAARMVLADCRLSHALLEHETDSARFRIIWAGAVALTRSVGNVLRNIDGKDQKLKNIADAEFIKWKTLPEHKIFKKFIDYERNQILKEYRYNIYDQDKIIGYHENIDDILLDDCLFVPVISGKWHGEDARDVLGEALAWWEAQLSTIDGLVTSS